MKSTKIKNFLDEINIFNLEFFSELSLILGAIIIGNYTKDLKVSWLIGLLLILFYVITKRVNKDPKN
jgi:hypothetical protein